MVGFLLTFDRGKPFLENLEVGKFVLAYLLSLTPTHKTENVAEKTVSQKKLYAKTNLNLKTYNL